MVRHRYVSHRYYDVMLLSDKNKNMYKELSAHDVAHELSSNEDNGFTYHGALALAQHIEDMEEGGADKVEFDPIALRCEFDEYPSALECAIQYGYEADDKDEDEDEDEDKSRIEEEARMYLEDRTIVIEFDNGVIIQAF